MSHLRKMDWVSGRGQAPINFTSLGIGRHSRNVYNVVQRRVLPSKSKSEPEHEPVYMRYLKWDGVNQYHLQEAQVWINGVNVTQNSGVHVEGSDEHSIYKGPKLYNNILNFAGPGKEVLYRTSSITLDLGQNYNYNDLQMILVLQRIAAHSTEANNDGFNGTNLTWGNGRLYGDMDFSILDENENVIRTYNKIGDDALRKVAHKYKFDKYSTLTETQESDWSYLYNDTNTTVDDIIVGVSRTYGAASNGWKIPTDNCVMTTNDNDGTIQVYDYVAP
jgi:hypothetical protein